ncbi:MAG: potassium-transporting ATPase subunit F, partial [Candidatus Thermoplasmatota archaeon]|nr:potassium-transporting ATPase subunit F [Candidatus Thermoplasmatota archaeon]
YTIGLFPVFSTFAVLSEHSYIPNLHKCEKPVIEAYVAVGLVVLALAVYLLYAIIGAEKF